MQVAIVLFWFMMNGLLLKRHLAAPPAPVLLPGAAAITEPMEEWWGIYYQGDKIGYAAETITPEAGGYFLEDSSLLRLNLLGTVQPVQTELHMTAAADWTLRRFDFDLRSNEVRFRARGEFAAGKLLLHVESGGSRTDSEMAVGQPPYLLEAVKPYLAAQNLELQKEQLFPIFDPSTLSQQIATVTVEAREMVKVGEKMEPAMRVRQRFKGISVISWIDGKGRTLKEESPLGLSMVREREDEAKADVDGPRRSLDLIAQTAVPVAAPIPAPDQKRLLKVRLSGFNLAHFSLDGERQRLAADTLEIKREDLARLRSYALPANEPALSSYLQSTPFLQSDDPRIRSLAKNILRGEKDAVRAAERIRRWVYDNLAKVPTVSVPNALEVLQTRRGDCNEHAVLFNALARAAGIPAKTAVGVVYLRGAFYYHAWSEVWLGQWVSVDPVLDQFPADVTHIKFLEGDIDRQVDILELIGKLKIEVMEAS